MIDNRFTGSTCGPTPTTTPVRPARAYSRSSMSPLLARVGLVPNTPARRGAKSCPRSTTAADRAPPPAPGRVPTTASSATAASADASTGFTSISKSTSPSESASSPTAVTTAANRSKSTPGRPRAPASKDHARNRRNRPSGSRTGAKPNATSPSVSTHTPPRPTMTTAPKPGTDRAPIATSTPPAACSSISTRDPSGAPASIRSAARSTSSVVSRPNRNTTDLALVHQPVGHEFHHQREAQRGGSRRGGGRGGRDHTPRYRHTPRGKQRLRVRLRQPGERCKRTHCVDTHTAPNAQPEITGGRIICT